RQRATLDAVHPADPRRKPGGRLEVVAPQAAHTVSHRRAYLGPADAGRVGERRGYDRQRRKVHPARSAAGGGSISSVASARLSTMPMHTVIPIACSTGAWASASNPKVT